jgi:hypothetical protein
MPESHVGKISTEKSLGDFSKTSYDAIITKVTRNHNAKKKPQSRFLRQERGFEGTRNAETQNRTADTAVFSRMLYQLSYLGVGRFLFYTVYDECQKRAAFIRGTRRLEEKKVLCCSSILANKHSTIH